MALKPRCEGRRRLVASATTEINCRYATPTNKRVSPAFDGRAKINTTLRVENYCKMSISKLHHCPAISALVAALTLLVLFSAGCIRRAQNQSPPRPTTSSGMQQMSSARININTASAGELESLPGIGKAFAARIIEHRDKYGPFRKPEHLIIVRGLSARRFSQFRDMITVE